MRYRLVVNTDPSEFVNTVARSILEGYTPQGGVSSTTVTTTDGRLQVEYAQAMVNCALPPMPVDAGREG